MLDGIATFVGLGETYGAKVRCRNTAKSCNRPLLVDVGLSDDGLLSGWAQCRINRRGCGATTCPMGRHTFDHLRDFHWEEGMTAGIGVRVPFCREGSCGILFDERERAVKAARFPNGSEFAMEWDRWRARSLGTDHAWPTIMAKSVLRLMEYYKTEKPRLEAAWREADRAEQEVLRAAQAGRRPALSPEQLAMVEQLDAERRRLDDLMEQAIANPGLLLLGQDGFR